MNAPSTPGNRLALAVVSCALFIIGAAHGPAARASATPRRIEVTAKRFEYLPAEIDLKKGEPVVLVLKSADVAHGVKFEELHLETEIRKNGIAELSFTPELAGTFIGHCSRFCGSGHGSMILTLHVTE